MWSRKAESQNPLTTQIIDSKLVEPPRYAGEMIKWVYGVSWMNGFCNFVQNDSSSNDLLFRISVGFIFWLFRLLKSDNFRFGWAGCRFSSVILFLRGLKGADSSLAHPSCLDMKLHLRVELRDIKSYSNTASVILRGAGKRSCRIY